MQPHSSNSLALDKETLITFCLEDVPGSEEYYPLIVASAHNGISRDLPLQAIFDAQTKARNEGQVYRGPNGLPDRSND
jgi:hypothetical protein